MPNAHTIIVMDADTAQERCQITLVPQRRSHEGGSIRVKNLAWSPSGDMLAVSLHIVVPSPTPADTDHREGILTSCEVHIYATITGECLESTSVPLSHAGRLELAWSRSLNVLAISSLPPGNIVTLLSAEPPVVHDVSVPAAPSRPVCASRTFPGIQQCFWTPCGSLLIVVGRGQGFYVLNPYTLETVLRAQQPLYERPDPVISWAFRGGPGSETKTVTAYLRGPRSLITCRLTAGDWHAKQEVIEEHGGWFGGCITPDGSALVVLQPQSDRSIAVVHADLRAQEITSIAPAYVPPQGERPLTTSGAHIKPKWAPFPQPWPPVYACVHMHLDADRFGTRQHACPQSVKLVDATNTCCCGQLDCATAQSDGATRDKILNSTRH